MRVVCVCWQLQSSILSSVSQNRIRHCDGTFTTRLPFTQNWKHIPFSVLGQKKSHKILQIWYVMKSWHEFIYFRVLAVNSWFDFFFFSSSEAVLVSCFLFHHTVTAKSRFVSADIEFVIFWYNIWSILRAMMLWSRICALAYFKTQFCVGVCVSCNVSPVLGFRTSEECLVSPGLVAVPALRR